MAQARTGMGIFYMVNPPNKIIFLSLIKRGFKLESVVNPFSKSPKAD